MMGNSWLSDFALRQKLDKPIDPKTNEVTKKEILYDGNLYDVTTFLHSHPGGYEILLNFSEAGEDATLAIQQFHARSIDKVLKMMSTLQKRPEPEIQLSKEAEQVKQRNAAMTADFVNLYSEMKAENLFKPSIPHWIYRFVELTAFGLLGFSLITETSNSFAKFAGSVLFGFAMGRGMWMMHEFGHISGTGNPKLDRFLEEFVMGITLGCSGSWWRENHSLHHAQINRVENDPDIYILPWLLLFNRKTLKDPERDQTFFERNQLYFLPIYAFLYYMRWMIMYTFPYLYRQRKIVEIVSISCHYFIMYQIGFTMWLMTAGLFAFYLFGNLFVTHTFVPMIEEPSHWVEQTFVSTVDVSAGPWSWTDWWMGLLNYQIEHHLFPTLPEYRLPLIVDRVKALAEKHGLPYYSYSYALTVRKTVGNLKELSDFTRHI